MTDFKVGDKVWTWNLLVWGGLYPHFTTCEITKIHEDYPNPFAELSHDKYADCAMPLNCLFQTKNQAIETMIKKLEEMKDV